MDRQLLSGDEAVALAALDAGVRLGTGYPGTPSTEILEAFDALGGRAQWAPNEKVALEVGLGVSYAGARSIVTMKHVGLNVAADPLFTAAYTGVSGAMLIVTADDPGMASSQNEQDNRRYAVAAGLPMVEPADSQEAYDFVFQAIEISERWSIPVLFRMTTRVCHAKSTVVRRPEAAPAAPEPHFEHDRAARVMIPAHAKPAHRRLRAKLADIGAWADKGAFETGLNRVVPADSGSVGDRLGLIANGVSYIHALEAEPHASVLKLGLVYPLPLEQARLFAQSVDRCVVIEEGDPVVAEALRAADLDVESKPDMYRFGELDVARIRRILARDTAEEASPPRGRPPALCPACPYHAVYRVLHELDCIVAGDIGCYSLGVLPPYETMDTLVAMGASLGVGLGLRHALPEAEARRVVSVIGDSTFVHSGVTGLVEMAYNPPATGHVVLVLDNGTTAMTGLQEHPATGRTLGHAPTIRFSIEAVARAIGIDRVTVIDAFADPAGFESLLRQSLADNQLSVIVARRPCILAAPDIRRWEAQAQTCGDTGAATPAPAGDAVGTATSGPVRERDDTGRANAPEGTVTNVVFAGLGGQGVIKASDILADAALRSGLDVKKSELHGMSQRGGSVASDVRFGGGVLSPMVPHGEADFLVVLEPTQVEVNLPLLAPGGLLLSPDLVPDGRLSNKRSLNVAMLGALSCFVDLPPDAILSAAKAVLPERLHAVNTRAFELGRELAASQLGAEIAQRRSRGRAPVAEPTTSQS